MVVVHLHLLRGDDAFSIDLAVQRIIASLGEGFDQAMNATYLDGKTASLEEIHTSVTTLPFFGSSRLVTLAELPPKLDHTRQDKFLSLLDAVPPSTHFVLTVSDQMRWRRGDHGWERDWEMLTTSHWLTDWFSAHQNAEIIDAPLPDEKEMDNWILAEVKRQGGKMDKDAAVELARHTGNQTSITSLEITKLLTYMDFQRPVTQADVLELVSVEGSADVFVMLDLLMDGRKREAQSLMHRLLDDNPPEAILGAVIFRYRQLIQVREALDEGQDLKTLVNKRIIFNNQVGKYTEAARRLNLSKLEGIYRHLLELDVQSKTSQADLATGLEMLVVETPH